MFTFSVCSNCAAVAQNFESVRFDLGKYAFLEKNLGRDGRAVLERFESADVDGGIDLFPVIVEARFGKSAGEAEDLAFEAGTYAAAASRPLTLVALARRLAGTRTDTSAQTFGRFLGAFGRF